MQLTLHADFALRILLYLGSHSGRPVSTQEIGRAYGISRHHLVRVVRHLQDRGYVHVTPGRFGGAELACAAERINIGAVVRSMETNLQIVECFDMKTNTCVIAPVCRLKGLLQDALRGFLAVLDQYTLADILAAGGAARLAKVFASR